MTRVKIVKEKYSAVFNSAVADKNRRIAEIKTPQKLPAIRYVKWDLNTVLYIAIVTMLHVTAEPRSRPVASSMYFY